MVVIATRLFRQALLMATLVCLGCGKDARVHLLFAEPEGAGLLASAVSIELAVSHDNRRIGFTTTAYSSGAQVSMPDMPKVDTFTLSVTARDVNDVPVAYGVLGPEKTSLITKGSGTCCLTMCLCSPAAHDAGTCTCGSDRCDASCPTG